MIPASLQRHGLYFSALLKRHRKFNNIKPNSFMVAGGHMA